MVNVARPYYEDSAEVYLLGGMCDACDDPLEMVSRWAVLVFISADEGVQLVMQVLDAKGSRVVS